MGLKRNLNIGAKFARRESRQTVASTSQPLQQKESSGALNNSKATGCIPVLGLFAGTVWSILFLIEAVNGTHVESSANYSGADLRNISYAPESDREERKRIYGLSKRSLSSGQVESGLTVTQRSIRIIPITTVVGWFVYHFVKTKKTNL